MDTVTQSADRALYEADEHAWIARQIDALRSGRLETLDRDTLVEYLTEMTIRDRRELKSRLAVLLQHLLKVRVQPAKFSRSWVLAIIHQQQHVRDILRGIPSLVLHAREMLEEAYADAVHLAAAETSIPLKTFPAESPWTIEAALAFVASDPSAKRKAAKR